MANAHNPISDLIHYAVVLGIALVVGAILAFVPCIVAIIMAAGLTAYVAGAWIDGPLGNWLGKRGIWS